MTLRDRLVDPRSPDRSPRRAAYALPTLFTAANVFLGFYALLAVFQGSMLFAQDPSAAALQFRFAAMAIGAAVFFDGLDGRIARMTNTVSDFGREMDSLADVITFGIAPAALAFAWGVYFVQPVRGIPSGVPAPRRLLSFVPLPAVRRRAPGSIQYSEEPDAEESRPARPQIFRRPADPRGRRSAGQHCVCVRWRAARLVDSFRGVAGAGGAALVSHGQHVALSQLQGSASDAAALAADRSCWLAASSISSGISRSRCCSARLRVTWPAVF